MAFYVPCTHLVGWIGQALQSLFYRRWIWISERVSDLRFRACLSPHPFLVAHLWTLYVEGKEHYPASLARKKGCWQMVCLNLWVGLVTVDRAFLQRHRILHHHWHLAPRTTMSIKPHLRQPWTNFSGIGNEISKWTDLLPEGGHQHVYSV